MSGDRLCYTCREVVYDYVAKHCGRKYCAAKRDIEKEQKATQGTRPPRGNDAVTDWTPATIIVGRITQPAKRTNLGGGGA